MGWQGVLGKALVSLGGASGGGYRNTKETTMKVYLKVSSDYGYLHALNTKNRRPTHLVQWDNVGFWGGNKHLFSESVHDGKQETPRPQ